ncbi:Lacal_2735 family protein [Gramella lutea]|uniref:Lacal_2735 family protein n=1 Tax=Christiangramia lutea TaxID=1607951 RepID=A0A9X1V164_9FLAO|nr:Lacal_2735 family protein [Christiangramia lutea]MCH4822412.1 Lacal_2735 family protein [Christiangramia lutea]
MFGLFKKKSEIEKLEIKYRKLLEEAHRLSTSNRSLSDEKSYEANEVLKEIDKLKAEKGGK